jgi:hypothetical protein
MSETGVPAAEPSGRLDAFTARMVAVASLLGAEVIHSAFMDTHYREWKAAGVFFLILSIAEGLLAMVLLVFPGHRWYRLAIAVSIATVALWFISRTIGLPFGPERFHREAISRGDSVATVMEGVTAAVLVPLLRWRDDAASMPAERRAAFGIVAVVVAVTVVLTAVGVSGRRSTTTTHGSQRSARRTLAAPARGAPASPARRPVTCTSSMRPTSASTSGQGKPGIEMSSDVMPCSSTHSSIATWKASPAGSSPSSMARSTPATSGPNPAPARIRSSLKLFG